MKTSLTALATLLALGACGAANTPSDTTTTQPAAVSEETIKAESARLFDFVETYFNDSVARSPISQTYLGIKTEDYGKWDDVSPEAQLAEYEISQRALADLREQFDPATLDESGKLTYRLFEYEREREAAMWPWRDYAYTFNQMFGQQSSIPAFMINQHRVADMADAEAYLSRLEGIEGYLGQHLENTRASVEQGIEPPAFVYEYVRNDAQNIITGFPFSPEAEGNVSPLMEDFRGKVASLELTDDERLDIEVRAETLLTESVGPAYEALLAFVDERLEIPDTRDGVWKLPQGGPYYDARLAQMTTTEMTADEIHDLGLAEVARIQDEMRAIMETVGFEGDLQDFFAYMRDPESPFYYDNTEEGRARYLSEATAYIDAMSERLPEVFSRQPQAGLIVKAVEPFREKSAGKAFYQRPSPDGSRPGTYYANLYDMNDMPIYQMEALAFHEGVPGHHMQIAIAQELENVPQFRKFGGYTAYTEGWGLYSEYFPKEMGFYEDPYSDFGRLAMEIWRAARLVVDTGLHHKKWTREEAVQYLLDNTPNPPGDCQKAIDRYIVMPGQATAYKIGMLKILELRDMARAELGDQFDIRAFHDVVIEQGPVPLAVLEDLVNEWVAETKAA